MLSEDKIQQIEVINDFVSTVIIKDIKTGKVEFKFNLNKDLFYMVTGNDRQGDYENINFQCV